MTGATPTGPEVSVVIPCRNEERRIGRQVDALAAQETDFPWEMIIVDDGSTDRTRAILDTYARNLSNLTVVPLPRSTGTGAGRNRGVERAAADKLLFVDANDEVHPGYIQAMSDALDDAEVCYACTELLALNSTSTIGHAPYPLRWDSLSQVGPMQHVPGGILGIRRDTFERVGAFNKSLPILADVEWCWRACRHEVPFTRVDGAVMHTHLETGTRSAYVRGKLQGADYARICETYADVVPPATRARLAVRLLSWLAIAPLASLATRPRTKVAWEVGFTLGELRST